MFKDIVFYSNIFFKTEQVETFYSYAFVLLFMWHLYVWKSRDRDLWTVVVLHKSKLL